MGRASVVGVIGVGDSGTRRGRQCWEPDVSLVGPCKDLGFTR